MKKLRTKFLVFILLPVLAIMTLAGVISYLDATDAMFQQLQIHPKGVSYRDLPVRAAKKS